MSEIKDLERFPGETKYLDLACKKLNVDPDSLLKHREERDYLVVITSEGKKYTFTFDELEDYYQYLEDNKSKPVKESKIDQPKKTTRRTRQKRTPPRKSKIPTASQEGPKIPTASQEGPT